MRKIALVVVAAVAVAGCSTASPTPAPSPAPSPSASRTAAAQPGAEDRVIVALSRIDPNLVAKPDRALSRAKNVCDSFDRYEGDEAKVADYTRQEFDGGSTKVDTSKAARIVAAVRSSGLCGHG